jgi:hypothetical protein
MKSTKLFLTAILLFVLGFAQAQNDYNPWKKYGYTPPKALTLSDGKYQEFFDADTIVQIGSVLFNTVTNEVVAFIKYDTTYSEATLEPHVISRWLSPDPLAQERPSWTPYNFCSNNPINRIDPDGRLDDIVITGENNSSVTLKTDMIDIKVNASSLGINFGGNHVLQGEDVLSAGLDIVGVFDPTGVADGLGATLAAKNGDWLSAGISGLGIIPYVGDLAKAGKIGKDIKIIENAIDAVHGNSKLSQKTQHGYEIFNKKTDEILEYGISGQTLKKGGGSPRIDQKLNTKYGNNPDVGGRVTETGIPNRQKGLDWEQGKVNDHAKSNNGEGPRFQKRPQPK